MVERIGVRELKNQASQIVRTVREEMAEYVITLNGKPVAMLRPIMAADEAALRHMDVEDFLVAADRLAAEIGAEWQSDKTAVQLIEEQRRG